MTIDNNQFIGRGEKLSKKILLRLLDCVGIQGQVNIKHIISSEEFCLLDKEIQNHNFDFVVRRTHAPDIVVEVNYMHGTKSDYKWNEIFVPLIKNAGLLALPINDYECDHLFQKSADGTHRETWQDYIDIIHAMIIVGILPDKLLE